MAGVIATIPRLRLTDGNGVPLVGGSVTVYAAGTTSLESTWQDRALTIFNTDPIPLDGLGSCVVWLDSTKTYKIVVKNAAGATLWTQDDITGGGLDSSFELSAGAIQAALIEAQGYRDAAAAFAAQAQSALAAAQAIASGSLVQKQFFTGAGPWVLTGTVVGVVGVDVNGQSKRMTSFSYTPSTKTVAVSDPNLFISSDSLIDVSYV
jgi:hypothetical protein